MGKHVLFHDFETRSACDLKKAGAYRYSEHPTTQVLCLGYAIDDAPVKLWHRAHPEAGIEESPRPTDLIDALNDTEVLVEAHNVFFETCIHMNCLRREFPWFPEVSLDRYRCSAALASMFALPRKLAGVGQALGLAVQKDMEGHRLMLKLSKPRKPRKQERIDFRELYGNNPEDWPLLWWEEPDELVRNWEYCEYDVGTERELSKTLRDMPEQELKIWQMDQRMNLRGWACDVELAEKALDLADAAVARMNAELRELTAGEVPKGSSRAKLKSWVNARIPIPLPDTKGDTVDEFLKQEGLDQSARRVLEICRDVNRTSTAKYKQMLNQVSDDGRIRDMLMYHGASTGRWSGKGVQPHNFVRGFTDEMEEVCDDILLGDPDILELIWGGVMEPLAKATRGALVSSPGRDLIVADFSAIEARVLLWLAGDEKALQVFREGGDIYCDLADGIYRYDTRITKKSHPLERQVGKTGILGLGYGMGDEKFEGELEKNGCPQTPEFATEIVRVYRKEKYPLVPKLWYETEEAAKKAIREPGSRVECGKVLYGVRGHFLHCRLPNGKRLSYYKPRLRPRLSLSFPALKGERKCTVRVTGSTTMTPSQAWKRAYAMAKEAGKELVPNKEPHARIDESIIYNAVHPKTKKWLPTDTYGGKLVENNTQAVARELMAEAMLRIDEGDNPYDLISSVHDEGIGEVDEDKGDLAEFETLMAEAPDWAEGCPIEAEGWRGKRYKKG